MYVTLFNYIIIIIIYIYKIWICMCIRTDMYRCIIAGISSTEMVGPSPIRNLRRWLHHFATNESKDPLYTILQQQKFRPSCKDLS